MDRFIVKGAIHMTTKQLNLKSNMDRFIDPFFQMSAFCAFDLKSNMDRFIVFIKLHL